MGERMRTVPLRGSCAEGAGTLLRLGGRAQAAGLLLCLTASCYHYRVMPPGPEMAATEPRTETVHAFLWGLVQPEPVTAENCAPSGALYDVKVSTNVAYLFVSVASLGLWVPMQLEWRCAKKPQPRGRKPLVPPKPKPQK